MSELNIFGLREYTRKDMLEDTTDEIREADRFYIMHEADAVIKDITKGAMSMFIVCSVMGGIALMIFGTIKLIGG